MWRFSTLHASGSDGFESLSIIFQSEKRPAHANSVHIKIVNVGDDVQKEFRGKVDLD